eukprot:135926-Pleurochrysis_carterae.AAC.2
MDRVIVRPHGLKVQPPSRMPCAARADSHGWHWSNYTTRMAMGSTARRRACAPSNLSACHGARCDPSGAAA